MQHSPDYRPVGFFLMSLTLTAVRQYCQKKPGKITEDFPFDEETLVVKVFGKSFLFTNLTSLPPRINLKCHPDRALELRVQYDAVKPGYHMNKRHWNTVFLDGTIPPNEILSMIDHSFEEVVKGLKKGDREKVLGTPNAGAKKRRNKS